MATVLDVARLAGVSTATVSRALSGPDGGVRAATRERVLAAADSLGYQPNRLPLYLKNKTVQTIGLIVNDIGNPFYTAIARGCEDVIRRDGYSLILASTDEDPIREEGLLADMEAERLAGIIITPSGKPSNQLLRMIRRGTPIVSMDREPGVRLDTVGVDNEAAAHEGVRHLTSLGHRRIGIVAGPDTIGVAQDRLAGYQRAIREAGILADPSLVRRGDLRVDGGYRAALELLDLDPRPTAVFSINNLTTIGILRATRQRAILMPADLSLVSFDDIPTGELLDPPLTVIAQPTYQLGSRAAELLLRRIAEPAAPVTEVVLHATLVIRGSTAPPSR